MSHPMQHVQNLCDMAAADSRRVAIKQAIKCCEDYAVAMQINQEFLAHGAAHACAKRIRALLEPSDER